MMDTDQTSDWLKEVWEEINESVEKLFDDSEKTGQDKLTSGMAPS
jgi:hypothetical protein